METQDNGFSIFHDLIIHAKVDKVFDAITQPEHLVNWWPLKCTGTPVLGEQYNFYFTPEYDWYGDVIKCEPDSAFHIKMTRSDEDWDPTSFGFDVTQEPEYVQVNFWHKGWPSCNHHFKRSSYCWAILLKGLKDYVEKGIIVPFKERE
jgi:uncharacterized protein YndB with AHSA1/START domain